MGKTGEIVSLVCRIYIEETIAMLVFLKVSVCALLEWYYRSLAINLDS
jgi:hypothetical protein